MAKTTNKKKRLHVEADDKKTRTIISPGAVLSERYKLIREVGRGGMGIVYEAQDQKLEDKIVAIKVLPPEMSTSKSAIKRLKKEAIAAMELHHENIVRLHSFDNDEETAYLVLEYIDGEPLDERLAHVERFTYEEACEVLKGASAGLAAAHEQGVIHRDIKPANLMYKTVGEKKVLRITDFGIAFVIKDSMTRITGMDSAGTLSYVAPELLKGERANEKTDQYSLAATIYELLSGDPPFIGAGLSHQILHAEPKKIENVPQSANAALKRALSKDASERFDNLEAFYKTFEGEGADKPSTPAVEAAVSEIKDDGSSVRMGIGIFVLIVLAFVSFGREEPHKPPPTEPTVHARVVVATPTKALTKIPKRSSPDSHFKLAEQYYHGKSIPRNLTKAVKLYELAAEKGHLNAQFSLGWCYEKGEGTAKNPQMAALWYEKATKQGGSEAPYRLGWIYRRGIGVAKDEKRAFQCFLKAAQRGQTEAQFAVGYAFDTGTGVQKNSTEAVKWYRKAAEKGNSSAAYNLGCAYSTKKPSEAARWYKKAAEAGHKDAQFELASAYANGAGIEKNPKEAIRWYKSAAALGNSSARFYLAEIYYYGTGVAKNRAKAADIYKKAASEGHLAAQFALGWCLEKGEGVTQDKAKAYELYRKAAAKGHENSIKRLKKLGLK